MSRWKNLFLRQDSVNCVENNKYLRLLCEDSFMLCFLVVGMASLTRIYFCMYPKDFWFDECMIALAIDKCSWPDIFQGNLAFYQRCPIAFAIINKLLNIFTSYTPRVLYVLSTALGICLLILMCRLCITYDKNKSFAFICISLVALCQFPLYYSSDFKQYCYEMLTPVILYLFFFNDLKKVYNRNTFISLKYPFLFSVCTLFSNTTVFIAASLCLTMYCYILSQERAVFFKITGAFISRYVVYAIFCIAYYLFFLKNEEILRHMYLYWDRYFIPHNISELPTYIKNTFWPLWTGMFTVKTVNKFPLFIFVCFIWGIICIYRKNKYEFMSLFLLFCIAIAAGLGFYPLGHGGLIGARMSSYLFPVIIFVSAFGVYKILYCLYEMVRIRKRIVYIFAVLAVVFVFYVNCVYIARNITYIQQTFSLFEQAVNEYEDGDKICTYQYSDAVFEYWLLINKLHFDRVYLMENTNIEKTLLAAYDSMSKNRKMLIVYSHFWGNKAPDTYLKIFKERGCDVLVKKSVGAELHIVRKQ